MSIKSDIEDMGEGIEMLNTTGEDGKMPMWLDERYTDVSKSTAILIREHLAKVFDL